MNGTTIPPQNGGAPPKKQSKIVAIGTKVIEKFRRAGTWVRKHDRMIYLSAAALAALIGMYWEQKLRIERARQTMERANVQLHAKTSQQIGKLYRNQEKLTNLSSDIVNKHLAVEQRVEAMEKTVNDPHFRDWLKKQHGIHNLTPIKKNGGA